MHRHLAGLAVLSSLVFAGSTAQAGSYYLEFSSLLPEQAQTIYSYSDQGFTLSDSSGFSITGPRAPSYSGMVGLTPGTTWTLTDNTGGPIDAPGPNGMGALALDVRPISDSKTYDLQIVGKSYGEVQWTEILTGKMFLNDPQLPIGLAPATSVEVTNLDASTPYQVVGLTITTITPASVPEPSTATMGAIALVLSSLTSRGLRRRLQPGRS